MASLLDSAVNNYNIIPTLFAKAERHLDQAQKEFEEGVFAPFWDEIENAANNIASYQKQVEIIKNAATHYKTGSDNLPVTIPKFTLPAEKLPDIRPTVIRLQAIVRKAQKSFSVFSDL